MEKAVYNTKIALAVANAVYKNGYVRTTEADYNERKSNKTLVIEELAKENPKYAKKDIAMADDIIDLLQVCYCLNLVILTMVSKKQFLLYCTGYCESKRYWYSCFKSHLQKLQLTKKQEKPKKKQMASKAHLLVTLKNVMCLML